MIQVSKKFLPSLSIGFEDPRVEVHIEDGVEFMKRHRNKFDVIITDSSDPIGMSRVKAHITPVISLVSLFRAVNLRSFVSGAFQIYRMS